MNETDENDVRTQTLLENALLLQIENLRKKEPEIPFLVWREENPHYRNGNGVVNLHEILEAGKKYTCGELLFVLKKLSFGFARLQEIGIANRDVKPANVILVEDERNEGFYDYKISDFGIGAYIGTVDQNISCKEISGISFPCAAPEVKDLYKKMNVDKNFDEKYNPFLADVYSLGIIALKMINFSFNTKKVKEVQEILVKKYEKLQGYEEMFEILDKMPSEDPNKRLNFRKIYEKVSKLEGKLNHGSLPKEEILYFRKMIENKEQSKTKANEIFDLYNEHKTLYEAYILKISRLKEANYHLELSRRHLERWELKLLQEKIETLINFGFFYQKSGKLVDSEHFLNEALNLCEKLKCKNEDHKLYGLVYFTFGILYEKWGVFVKAELSYNKCLNIRLSLYGEKHAETANCYNNMGEMYENKGDFPKAKDYFQNSLKIRQELFKDENADTAESLNNLGILNAEIENFEESEKNLLKGLEIRRKLYGEIHNSTAFSYNNLGFLYQNKGELEKAEENYMKSLEIRRNLFGDFNSNTAQSWEKLSEMHRY